MNTLVSVSAVIEIAFSRFTTEKPADKNAEVNFEKDQPGRTIVINSDDQMRFDTKEIKVKAGKDKTHPLRYRGNGQERHET